jgi:GTPase SAR1 family protein
MADVPVILVLGQNGAGKTTFIENIAKCKPPVGETTKACTTTTQAVFTTIDGQDVVLVDTPSFNEPKKSDAEILQDVTAWIECKLHGHKKVHGTLYLHNIMAERIFNSSTHYYEPFSKLIGSHAMHTVGLVTTRWDIADRAQAKIFEKEILEDAWSHMRAKGARKYRVGNESDLCTAVAWDVLQAQPSLLRIQDEIGQEKKQLSRTDAGAHVCQDLVSRIQVETARVGELQATLDGPDSDLDAVDKGFCVKNIIETQDRIANYKSDYAKIKHTRTWKE